MIFLTFVRLFSAGLVKWLSLFGHFRRFRRFRRFDCFWPDTPNDFLCLNIFLGYSSSILVSMGDSTVDTDRDWEFLDRWHVAFETVNHFLTVWDHAKNQNFRAIVMLKLVKMPFLKQLAIFRDSTCQFWNCWEFLDCQDWLKKCQDRDPLWRTCRETPRPQA
jgi:hypothetical protein